MFVGVNFGNLARSTSRNGFFADEGIIGASPTESSTLPQIHKPRDGLRVEDIGSDLLGSVATSGDDEEYFENVQKAMEKTGETSVAELHSLYVRPFSINCIDFVENYSTLAQLAIDSFPFH